MVGPYPRGHDNNLTFTKKNSEEEVTLYINYSCKVHPTFPLSPERPSLTVLVSGLAEVREINLLSSLHLHNTSFSGLEQQPGPHSPHPAAAFTGSSRSVYFSSPVRDSITSLIQSSKEFSFLTSIRQKRQNSGTIFAFSYGQYQTNR